VTGSLAGATVGAAGHFLIVGLVLGAAGAVAGTLAGSAARARLAAAFHRDLPAALLEDIVGIAISALCIQGLK
jgi:uncharacterized membrane protein